ncbi:hypothetical protein [Nocardioides alkalitolerans]|uniref:hypothetical protein n=1 Tax=Nocardioides alkalitolerans TaxID=281714 RepID=UPI00040AEFEB|nr:hypothetical protein [Nocardioides alkalitolerans]
MGANSGRRGRPWNRLKAEVYARRSTCCRCRQAIDYTRPYRDPLTGKVDSLSKSVDHYPHPLETHPHLAEDPANLAAAHLGCNLSAGMKGATSTLGETTEEW